MTGAGRWVSVGRVGRPHGLEGGFVVENASEEPERFVPGARVYADREPATVVDAKRAGGRLVVRLDREVPRGAALELPEAELPPLAEDEFYAYQLEGLEVAGEGGETLGRVERVEPGVANDVLALDTGLRLPLVEDCVREVDLAGRRITVARDFVQPA